MSDYPWGEFGLNLAYSAVAAFAVLLITWLIAVIRGGPHRTVDIAWGLGFAAVAVTTWICSSGDGDGARRTLLAVLTVVWGVRLAGHIGWRGWGKGEDPRYARMLSKAPGHPQLYALRKVYLLQAALVWLISLPVQAGAHLPGPLGWVAVVGVAVWAVGLFFETVGDHQMHRFKSDPAHRGAIMDRGLWSWTRHPNYFGDFMVWWGLFLVAAGTWQIAALTVVSPLLMSFLLIFGSGKRLLERSMAERPGFAEYAARTSGFFPLPPRRDARPEDGPRP
ncbi:MULTISPECIES: DUF1295 domain-containing protein [Streptomyces]|uniref:DUF1295 domain-containing protein n=1 Tax=Streptomyces TaxID=1883 RepID=UPI000CD4E524|nr:MULTISPECIES: DUF1295 domain-containing protein [Streptomyces]